ncbi:MAG TPA: quinone oxidoreductase [Spirochaetia bacterium]|nr:quinone oxidoreductase [Spirochaetia bacterium]
MKAIQVDTFGGPEVLQPRDLPDPQPGPGQVRIRLSAIGVNFIDVNHRNGRYSLSLPFIPGQEGAGTVDAVGDGVRTPRPGARVAFANLPGAYAELLCIPAERAVPVPSRLTFEQAAAVMLQGMTAHYLATDTCPLVRGDVVLVHAAAGGVGLLLVQVARRRGARVIATVSTAEKEALARGAGADEVIRYTEVDFVAEVRRLTGGRGVRAVYDSVGRDTFTKSLDCLSPRGMMVLFGQSSGKVEGFDPTVLGGMGSLYLTRPTLGTYISSAQGLHARASEVLGWTASGKLKVRIGATLPLAEAAGAHRRLEGRATTGKLLLLP